MYMQPGKFRGFQRISGEDGVFRILALDQRNSLKKMLMNFFNTRNEKLMTNVKKSILKTLSPYVSAVLVDGEYAFPSMLPLIPPQTGVILSLEKSGYIDEGKGRLNVLYREDGVEYARKSGADAVKLLIYWSTEAHDEVKKRQMKLVKEVGMRAKEQDILFILEILTYGKRKGRDEEILEAVKTFSGEEYCVDIFKIEPFKELKSGTRVKESTSGKPWVILSGGMDVIEFERILSRNVELGASGFLAGRVIWKNSVRYADTVEKLEKFLCTEGTRNLRILTRSIHTALPWYSCEYFGGYESLEISS